MKKKLTYHNFYFYLLLLSPILVVYILFFALPVVSSMFFSLTNFNGISLDFKWMGLKNYDVAFHDRVFRKAMVNTFYSRWERRCCRTFLQSCLRWR